jgi:hypothetical protein
MTTTTIGSSTLIRERLEDDKKPTTHTKLTMNLILPSPQ